MSDRITFDLSEESAKILFTLIGSVTKSSADMTELDRIYDKLTERFFTSDVGVDQPFITISNISERPYGWGN